MSMDVCLTNDKNSNSDNSRYFDEITYLNSRLSYLEKIIQSKYSDILYLASEICNLKNVNLQYDLIDILIKHGSNLHDYKSELVDVKDMINSLSNNLKKSNEHDESLNDEKENDEISNLKPHDSQLENKEIESAKNENVESENFTNEKDDNEKHAGVKRVLSNDIAEKTIRVVDGSSISSKKSKAEVAREKILSNLEKLISYKENTFNDLIEMIDFHIDSSSQKNELTKFIESLENQIVELNEYKNNILKNYSLSKSIELGANGKITFSRVFIEKERLIDRNKEEYIKVVEEMYDLYSEFVDKYLKNISMMKPHLSPEKINSMQSNCSKVIYDLKLIKILYSSLDKIKGV